MMLFTRMLETEGKLNLDEMGVGRRNQDFCLPFITHLTCQMFTEQIDMCQILGR